MMMTCFFTLKLFIYIVGLSLLEIVRLIMMYSIYQKNSIPVKMLSFEFFLLILPDCIISTHFCSDLFRVNYFINHTYFDSFFLES